MPAINEEGMAYIIRNTGNTNEYYILENRQQTTFGTGNHGHGLMVWHIDYNRTAWNNNQVNANKDHQRMTFLPADGKVGTLKEAHYGYYYEISSSDEAGDPYPGRQDVKEVQQLSWFIAERNGTKLHQNLIRNIYESSDGKISFTYGDYVALPTPDIAAPTDITANSFTANWLPVEGATSYTLEVEAMGDAPAPATILAEDFSKCSSVNEGTAISNSIIDRYTQNAGWSASGLFGTGDESVRISSGQVCGYITTPALQNQQGKLVVEFDAAYYNSDGSSVIVSVLNGGQTVGEQTVQLAANSSTYSCTFENVPAGCKIKFGSTAKKKRFYLYNVNIMDMSGVGSVVATYTGLTTTSFTIEPISADMYYYRVQAVCDDGTSDWSDWMDVDIAASIEDVPKWDGGNGSIFDISGHRLQHVPQHGLYIRDGKIYVVR